MEVDAIVEDYFDMLRFDLNELKYNKAEHRRDLLRHLNDRSHGSVEFKHQNISAVLIEMGIPYIDGYKPRFNYQRSMLPYAVSDYISKHDELHDLFSRDSNFVPAFPTVQNILDSLEKPPEPNAKEENSISESAPIYNPTGVNYLEKEAQNKDLGEAGEQFILNYERARLIHAGKERLANRIEQVSRTIGPAAGYDIRSYDTNGQDRFIEAKTTKYGKSTPFFVTPNELNFSKLNERHYYLYRLFKFREEPRMFMFNGFLKDRCRIKPSQYIAKPA